MDVTLGGIRMFAGNFAPQGWAFCHGQQLPIAGNNNLFSLLGTIYGGDGRANFNLPDMRDTNGVAPMGMGAGPGLTPREQGRPVGYSDQQLEIENAPSHNHQLMASAEIAQQTKPPIDERFATGNRSNSVLARGGDGTRIYSTQTPDTEMASAIFPRSNNAGGLINGEMASTFINFIIATEGIFPSRDDDYPSPDEALIGEICIMPYTFVPDGWEPCDGQYLSTGLYSTLYAVIGNTFGSPRKGLFRLPDLRARVPIGPNLQGSIGAQTGENRAVGSWPSHTHSVLASSDTQGANSSNNPEDNTFGFARFRGTTDNDVYGPLGGSPTLIELNTETVSYEGNSDVVYNTKNMQPYLGVQLCICATAGEYPARP